MNYFKLLTIPLILSTTLSAGIFDFDLFKSDKDIKIEQQKNMKYDKTFQVQEIMVADNDTKFRTLTSLKTEQSEIITILKQMEVLENMLSGFEERKVLTVLRKHFDKKYQIKDVDIIPIKVNLNQILQDIKTEGE
jgi:hypothetical protein